MMRYYSSPVEPSLTRRTVLPEWRIGMAALDEATDHWYLYAKLGDTYGWVLVLRWKGPASSLLCTGARGTP